MTVANEFFKEVEGDEEAGPVIFGVAITPQIIGTIIGVVGALLAGFLIYKAVLPALAQKGTLEQEIATKQDEIQKQEQRIKEKDKAERERAEALQRKTAVTAMFADDASLETLLFDINEQINKINSGIKDDDQKATLTQFKPVPLEDANPEGVVNDSSFGSQVAGKLRQRKYEVQFEGTYAQTRQFLMSLERLQPLLVVKNLKWQLADSTQEVQGEYRQGKFVPSATQPQRRLKTTFELYVLMPLNPDQIKAQATAAEAEAKEPEKAK